MYTYPYEMMSCSIDCIVIKENEDPQKDEILLIRRKSEPFKDCWALVGGFIEINEKVEDAFKREVKEEINLDITEDTPYEFINFIDTPNRDPRQRTISFLFDVKVDEETAKPIKAGDDAAEYKFVSIYDVINKKIPLAFDHQEILDKYFGGYV